jgi:rhodanese-related sulfurtransferase
MQMHLPETRAIIEHPDVVDYSLIEIEPLTASQIVESGDGIIVDVRLMEEMDLFGEVPGAISLPLGIIQSLAGYDVDPAYMDEIAAIKAEQKVLLLSMLVHHAFRNTTLLCLCRSGKRSILATKVLRSLGYHLSYSIAGGLQRWEEQGCQLIHAKD